MKVVIETKRLLLREMTADDFSDLYAVLADSDIMQHYPYTFDKARVRRWIERNIERYKTDGFGLWAVILKKTGEFIGDCGITMQNIKGEIKPEIGYHIHRNHQRKGYASEAAAECMWYAFEILGFDKIFSYMKYTNTASCKVALKNGMKFIEEYPDPDNTFTRIYAMDKEEWKTRKASLVFQARQGIDPVGICGHHCDHCFLAQKCGGCRSDYNCCSFAVICKDGVCPNVLCANEKGIDGCRECAELEICEKGFYGRKNEYAAKATAFFIREYGKECYSRTLAKAISEGLEYPKSLDESGSVQTAYELLKGYINED